MQLYKSNDNFTVKTVILLLKRLFFVLLYMLSEWSFYHFTISKYNSTLTHDERTRFDRFQIVTFFQNRPTACRSSGDYRLTLYRWEKSWKKVDRSMKFLTYLLWQRNRRPTKTSSQIGGNIGRQSTVLLQKPPPLIFAHRKSGDGRLG